MGYQESLQRLLNVCVCDPLTGKAALAKGGRLAAATLAPAALRRIEQEVLDQQGRAQLQRAMAQAFFPLRSTT